MSIPSSPETIPHISIAAEAAGLTVVRLLAFEDNYLWLIHDGKNACVVDPGDATPIIDYLAEHDLTLTTIYATHHHGDHVGGVAALVDWCGESTPALRIFGADGPANEAIPHRTDIVRDGTMLSNAAPVLEFQAIAVPGHTASHVAYFDAKRRWIFCGDTMFAGGCGRLMGGTPAQMLHSLNTLAALPDDTKVFCAHEYTLANLKFAMAVEPNNTALQSRVEVETATRKKHLPTVPSTIAIERATNPFLRSQEPEVKHAILRASSGSIASNAAPDMVFGALREWKNRF
jgi:hydroxyacylglutathione hydrolase